MRTVARRFKSRSWSSAPVGWTMPLFVLDSQGEQLGETRAEPSDHTTGDRRRRAADGEGAHRLLARDLSWLVAGSDAGSALDRGRGDTLAANARSASRSGCNSRFRRRPARSGRWLWVVRRAAHGTAT